VTLSFGAAQFRAGETLASFVDRADVALYRAKRTGRNRVEIEEPKPEVAA
jgi:PleD family two-component response regulator